MKRFIVSVLCVAVFFIGVGSLVDKVGAKFKSDERALTIIAQARQAIGGDAAIKNIRSMTITGNAAQTFTIDGATRTEQGNLEIAFQLPGQFSKMLKIGKQREGANGELRKETKVFITTNDDKNILEANGADAKKKVFIIKNDGEGKNILTDKEIADGKFKRVVNYDVQADTSHMRHNELFRTTFALLLSAPEGLDASYNYGGEASVDGNNCDVILAQSGGSAFKFFIDQSTHLPLMLSYQGAVPLVFKFNRNESPTEVLDNVKTVIINADGTQTERNDKEKTFIRRIDGENKTAEYQVKFSDYRSVNGVQLPYKWTQTVNNQPDQNVDVVSYEINPPNIADKFNNQRVLVRMKKPQ